MNRGIVEFSEQYVRERLGLPDGSTIVAVRYGDPFDVTAIQFVVENPSLPVVGESERPQFVRLREGRFITQEEAYGEPL